MPVPIRVRNPPSQQVLEETLKYIFPNSHIHVNARKEHSLKYAETGEFLELDCWIPEYNLSVEFQDEYHYITTWFSPRSQQLLRQRDNTKKTLATQHSMHLVTVPCWWDGSYKSLGASIKFELPNIDLISHSVEPIPLNPPKGYLNSRPIPNVGELMLALFLPDYSVKDFSNWWMGEKYDGVRLCYAGDKQIYTRKGVEVYLPPSFPSCFPHSFLDGEFWFGRGQFYLACMLVNSAPEFVHWHMLRMIVFDNPFPQICNEAFEKRYELLLNSISNEHPFIITAMRVSHKHRRQLHRFSFEIIANEGEGLILREPASRYLPGRSMSLIKFKSALCDQEAMVIAITHDSVVLRLPNELTFLVPHKDVHIETPMVGQIVTFSFERRTPTDLPFLPSIVKVRDDITWEDVMYSTLGMRHLINYKAIEGDRVSPLDESTTERTRNYLENYARSKNMDPLVPETWYALAYPALQQFQTTRAVLAAFHGSYYNAIQHFFPTLHFNKNSFPEAQRLRAVFENYAQRSGFDFLSADHWYLQSNKKITSFVGVQDVLAFYRGNIPKALIELFPEVKFDESKFLKASPWRNMKKRRLFFEQYAKENNFDALVPENWYLQRRRHILSKKGAVGVLAFHDNSVQKALVDLFPNISFEKNKFRTHISWKDTQQRRAFFEQFAEDNKFDPLVPENWYSLERKQILSKKGAAGVLLFHENSIAKALSDLFQNISFDKFKFRNQWRDVDTRRKFFEQYAVTKGFEPSQFRAWTPLHKRQIQEVEGLTSVLSFHQHSITKALHDLFPSNVTSKTFVRPQMQYG